MLYWAQALAEQNDNIELKNHFETLAKTLTANEMHIISELNAVQGQGVDINGYYFADDLLASQAMRPSTTLNSSVHD